MAGRSSGDGYFEKKEVAWEGCAPEEIKLAAPPRIRRGGMQPPSLAELTCSQRQRTRVSARQLVHLSPTTGPWLVRLLSYSRILFAIAVLLLIQSKL